MRVFQVPTEALEKRFDLGVNRAYALFVVWCFSNIERSPHQIQIQRTRYGTPGVVGAPLRVPSRTQKLGVHFIDSVKIVMHHTLFE